MSRHPLAVLALLAALALLPAVPALAAPAVWPVLGPAATADADLLAPDDRAHFYTPPRPIHTTPATSQGGGTVVVHRGQPGQPQSHRQWVHHFPFTWAARFQLGFEAFSEHQGLPAHVALGTGFGAEVGIAAPIGPGIRIMFVPISVDLMITNFYWDEDEFGGTGRTSTIGGRWMIGMSLEMEVFAFGFRYGTRDYWDDPETGNGISLVGDDSSRDIFFIHLDVVSRPLRFGLAFEIPIASDASVLAMYATIELRLP